jgi:Tol biopolymer transport system component
MSLKKIFILIAFTAAILMAFGFQNSSEYKVLFEKAKFTMETKGDLKGAIKLFSEIIKKYPDEREYAAKSQLYIGLCYEKLGMKEAQKAFQKVIDNYPSQTETVKVAKEKLSILIRAQTVIKKGDKEFKITKFHSEKRGSGRLSPDGKKLALIREDYTEDTESIYIRDIASGKEVHLVDELAVGIDSFLCWSPDSKTIAYVDFARMCTLKVVSIKGGPPRTIIKKDPESSDYGFILPSSWTSDGKRIVFKDYSRGLFSIPAAGGEWGEIYAYSSAEEAKQRKLDRMTLSPDGKYIAYESEQNGNRDIYVMPVKGGESVRITDNITNDRRPFWSYDGKWLAFYSARTGESEIWVVGITSDGEPVGKPFQVTRGGARGGVWTKEGKISYTTWKIISHLFTANTDGSEEIQLTKINNWNAHPRWSPDGESIAFATDYGESDMGAIWIVPAKGGDEEFLTIGRSPCWSPDGKMIAFIVPRIFPEIKAKISIIPVEGGKPKELLAFDGDLGWLDWSPNGKHIAFSYSRGKDTKNPIPDSRIDIIDIYIISVDGGEPMRLTKMDKKGFKFTSSRWSPDGKEIAFRSMDFSQAAWEGKGEQMGIWTINVRSGDHKLITTGLDAWRFCWSPDGRYIISSKHEEDSKEQWMMDHKLYRVSAEGGKPEKLNIMGQAPDFSPDGKKIVFSRTIQSGDEFWLVENFLPKEKN